MPKELHEIRSFQAGTITTPDTKDIPEDAASYSLNLDSVSEDGKLKGVPNDAKLLEQSALKCTASGVTSNGATSILVDNDGQLNLFAASGSIIFVDSAGATQYLEYTGAVFHAHIPDTINGVTGWSGAGNLADNADVYEHQDMTVDASKLAIINNNGIRDVIYYEADTNKLHSITDLYAKDNNRVVPVTADLATIVSGSDEVTMQKHNKEVHIGAGSASTDIPKWVGYPDHGQWGADPPDTIQTENAEPVSPTAVVIPHKIVRIGDYLYAVEYNGFEVYKYKHTDNTFVKSGGAFISITAMCQADADYLFVFDSSAGAFGTVYKVATDELTVVASYSILVDYRNNTATDKISDMHVTNTKLWLASHREGSNYGQNADKILYNVNIPTSSGGTITLDDRTFTLEIGSIGYAHQGMWKTTPAITTYKICLGPFKETGSDTDVVSYVFDSNEVPIQTYWNGSALVSHTPSATCVMCIKEGASQGERIYSLDGSGSVDNANAKVKMFTVEKYDETSGGEDRTPLSIYNTTKQYVISYLSGVDGANGILAKYANHAFTFAAMSLSSGSNIPEITIEESKATNDIGSPAWTRVLASGDDWTFKGLSTRLIGRLNTIVYDTDPNTFGDVTTNLTNIASITATAVADSGTIGEDDTDTYQLYRASLTYDNYQESPLSFIISNILLTDEKYSLDLTIRLRTTGLSKRISHLNIYRVATTLTSNVLGFYRLVKSIPLNSTWGDNDGTTGVGVSIGAHKYIQFTDTGELGASYEARAGMSELLDSVMVNYALSTQLNSEHIVAKCYKTDVDDADRYVFKSKPHRFDTFDWSRDFLIMPDIPTALASFNGRLYAFDENNTYQINSQSMYIEDTFNGVGCIGPDSVAVTEYGMCFCDKNNIYLHNGQVPIAIGDSILDGDTSYSWRSKNTAYVPKVMFDAVRNSYVIFFQGNDDKYYAWFYNIARKRWDLIHFNNSLSPKGILHGKNGEMHISNGTNLVHFLGGTSFDSWEWQSKEIVFGIGTLKKFLYIVKGEGDAHTITYGVDGATPTTSLSSNKIASGDKKSKSLKIKIVPNAVANKVDSVGILYRRLPATSGNI